MLPIKPISSHTSARLFPRSKRFWLLMSKIIARLNALVAMRAGNGIRIHKASSGWVIEATGAGGSSELPADVSGEWYRVCIGGVEYYQYFLTLGGLYTVDINGNPGTLIQYPASPVTANNHPFTDSPAPS